MATTPPNNTPPNSKKMALEAAKERRDQVLADLERLEVEKKQEVVTANKARIQREINKLIKEEDSLRQRIALFGEKEEKLQKSVADLLADQISSLNTKKALNNKILDAEEHQLTVTKRLQTLLQEGKITTERVEEITKRLNRNVRERATIENEVLKSQKKQEELQKAMAKAQRAAATEYVKGIESNMRKVPVIGDLMANTLMGRQAQKALTKQFAKFFKSPGLKRSFVNARGGLGIMAAGIALTAAGLKATFAREQEMKDQQRSIGLTNEQSEAVYEMQRGLLNTSGNMVVSLEEARKASAELVDDFGVMGASNSEMVSQQVALTKAYGLQAEEATNLQKAAMINGQSTEEMKLDILATAEGFNKAKGSSYSLSGIMKTVSKLSDSVRLQFRGSNTELTAAVMKAKALGTTLEDLNGIADGLLNIESSIESQVTAQLVTGRNINMDRARMFALMDDMPGLMDELVKQEIDYAAYSKMNRIEKQSTAAALGMNVDQMAKFVSQQELSKQLGIDMSNTQNQTAAGLENSLKSRQEEIAQLAKAGNLAAQQYEKENEALTTQEKLTAAVEQMAKWFEYIGPAIAAIGIALTVVGVVMAALVIKAAAMAAYAALQAAFINPVMAIADLAVGAALVGSIGVIGMSVAQRVSDGQAPSSKGPFTITDKFGATAVTQTGDSVVVSPNISRISSQPNTNTNLASNNKPAPAPIVNVSLVVGNTAINEIGNKISMNQSYNQGVGNTYNRLG
jgi:hypothetical protein